MIIRTICLIVAMVSIAACTNAPSLETPGQAYSSKPVYDYPIANPYAATIITMPPEMKVDYSGLNKPHEKTITLFPDRQIPQGFWYQRGLKYAELLQPKPSELVYVIAGTGADADASYMRIIADVLYTGGFSVVLLPSPTHPNFIINASENFISGNPWQDSKDLYRVMEKIDERVSHETRITGHALLGYSLGAWHAAYTAKLDDERHVLNFSRVLLINPPLSLYGSMKVIDSYLYRAIPSGINGADNFVKQTVARLSSVSQSGDPLDFSNERLLLDAYTKYRPDDDSLATMIGLSFRLSAVDMIFTADVMSHDGYIFPKDEEFTTTTPLNSYMGVALRTSFQNYLDEMYLPKLQKRYPFLTRDELIRESSLESMSGYLSGNNKFRLITNKDDIILGPGDLEKLEALFAPNTMVFANGGHLGNLGHPAVAYRILQFMKQ